MESPTPSQVVARNVKAARTQRGWSARALAERCAEVGASGLNRPTLANIESGRRGYVTVDELLALSAAFGISPLILLPTPWDKVPELAYGLAMQVAASGEPDYGLINNLLSSGIFTAEQADGVRRVYQATAARRKANYEAMEGKE